MSSKISIEEQKTLTSESVYNKVYGGYTTKWLAEKEYKVCVERDNIKMCGLEKTFASAVDRVINLEKDIESMKK